MRQFDITIIGGGLAGASLALALRSHPARVAVIDSSERLLPAPVQGSDRRIALSDSSRKIFSTLNIWQSVEKDAIPIRALHVSEKNTFGVTRVSAEEEGLNALAWTVPYRLLFNAFRRLLMETAEIEFLAPATVKSLTLEPDHSTIYMERDGEITPIHSDLLIIADGGSKLQEMAGFTSHCAQYNQTAIVTTIETERPAGTTAYERFTSQGPLAVLPDGNQRCGVVWMCAAQSSEQVMAWDNDQFIARLQADFGRRLGNILKIGSRAAYPLELRYVDRLVNGRAIVIGNSAHTLHPVAAQGFNLTLRDIAELADALFQSPNMAQLDLQAWEANRMRDMRRAIKFTDFLARATTPPIFSAFRSGALLAFDLCPPLRRSIVRGSLGLLPPLSRLASGLPLQRHERT